MNGPFSYLFLALFTAIDLVLGVIITYVVVRVSTALLCSNTIMTAHQNLHL